MAEQAKGVGVQDKLLWLDGYQTPAALSTLLLCSAAYMAPSDEQSPTSVSAPALHGRIRVGWPDIHTLCIHKVGAYLQYWVFRSALTNMQYSSAPQT